MSLSIQPNPASIDDILRQERERQRAAQAADVGALEAVLDDELVYIHATARRDSKVSYIESIASRRIVYEHFDCVQVDYDLVGDSVAFSDGRMRTTLVASNERKVIDVLFIALWINVAGTWRMRTWQSTFAPKQTDRRGIS